VPFPFFFFVGERPGFVGDLHVALVATARKLRVLFWHLRTEKSTTQQVVLTTARADLYGSPIMTA
jgi:hypothetical protein